MDFSTCSKLDLLIAETQGHVQVTRLPTCKPKKSDLVLSMTKGVRTNTNRKGQTAPSATHAIKSIVEGNSSSYFKTTG